MRHINLEQREQPDSPLTLRWTGKARTFIGSSVRASSCIIYADWGGNIVALDEATGEKVWAVKARAAVSQPLFVFQGLVWALDNKGYLIGYGVADGQPRTEYRLPFSGWNLKHHGDSIYFMNQTTRRRSGAKGRPSRLNLLAGGVDALTDRLASVDFGGTTGGLCVWPEENALALFLAPDLMKLSLVDGRLLQSWTIPGAHYLAGLISFDHTLLGITELQTSLGSRLGAARYLEHNPTPLIMVTEEQIKQYALLVRGVYSYRTSAVQLDERTFILEVGETVMRWTSGEITDMTALPERSIWGNRSAGLFKVQDELLVFQQQERNHTDADGYVLQVYTCDPERLQVSALGLPLRTHPHGRSFQGAFVDQYGQNFFLRGDGRYHYLSWQNV